MKPVLMIEAERHVKLFVVSSQELDLTNVKTFRDFSKPMGAQSKERLLQFQKRYREWDDPTGPL